MIIIRGVSGVVVIIIDNGLAKFKSGIYSQP